MNFQSIRSSGQSLLGIRAVALAITFAVPALAWADFQTDFQAVPEPETLALLGIGAIAMVVARWMRRK